MKKITLTRLDLTNFKGIKKLSINFDPGITSISGANATGKTTVFDAFLWLLFGKDSEDRKDYQIKTLDANNQPKHKLDHEVTAEFRIIESNSPVFHDTLRRVYREKWITKRGSAEEEMTGHETLFFWNDVPCQAGEYDSKIAEMFSGVDAKMITNPLYFMGMKWQDRRKTLIGMAGEIKTPDKFKKLLAEIGNKTLDEFRKELAVKKKKLRAELDQIPARIDEVQRSTPQSFDWAKIEEEIAAHRAKIAEIEAELSDLSKSYEKAGRNRAEYIDALNKAKSAVSEFEYEASRRFGEMLNQKKSDLANVDFEIRATQEEAVRSEVFVNDANKKIVELTNKNHTLRTMFAEVNGRSFDAPDLDDFVCPTCKQHLPDDDIEAKITELRESFNTNKVKELEAIRETGINNNKEIERLKESLAKHQNGIGEKLVALKEKRASIEKSNIPGSVGILKDIPGYKEAKERLAELEANPVVEVPMDQNETTLRLRKTGEIDQLNRLIVQLSTKDQVDQSKTRLEELSRQEKEYAQQLADLEKKEFHIQEYVSSNIKEVEERINSMFNGVTWKMFDTQINGGVAETCEALIDGVPWSAANNAAKINSGIHIINVLSVFLGVSAPIFVDNAESVNVLSTSTSQIIGLYVTLDESLTIN